ncbi:hypothetical protein [Scytonema hofmannii]|uniref:hypothetical protein n=1 Tax=Scytonema hofmannii TaxID=34078 RepID=UPI0003471A43|nr:hypothetical protein [Scytonema hofmannii]
MLKYKYEYLVRISTEFKSLNRKIPADRQALTTVRRSGYRLPWCIAGYYGVKTTDKKDNDV